MEDLEAPNGRRDALSSPTERRVQLQQRYSTPVVSDRDAVTQESSVKTRRSALSIPRLTKRLLGWASESRVHIIDAEYPVVPGAVQREISVQSENIRRSSKPRVVYRVDPVKQKCRLTQDFVHVMLQGQQASYASPSEFMKDLHSYLVDYELIENSEEQEELNSPRSATSAKSLDETVRVREISGFSSASLNGNAHEQNDDVHKRMTLKKRPSLMGASMNRTKVVRTLTKLEKISSMDQKMQKEIKNLISNFNTAAPHNLGINPNSYTADPSNPIQKGVPGLTSLMTMINHLCIEKCGEDLQQEYHEKYMYTQIKPHTDDVDMALLEELKSSRITFESIRYAFSDSKHLDFLRKKQSEFQEICADLLSEFKDNSGEIIFSKFKTHFSYWRSLCSRACINLPFLNLFDNLLFVLFYYDEFPEKHYLFQTEDSNDENPSERRPSSRSDEIRPSIQTIFNPDLSLESMDQGLNTISRIANHYAKVHFRQKRMLFGNKLDTSSAQTNVNSKFSRAKDKVTDLSSQILTAILFILTVIVGVLVMFFSWKLQLENLSSTSYHRIADSTLYSSKATLHNHFDFASSWMGMVKHKTDESIFYSGGFSTDLEFQHRLVYISWTHNAKSCYIGSSSGVFIGVMSNADDSSSNYFTVFLRNESSGPLYSFPASIDPVLGTVSFGVSSLFSSNFSFEHLPWFITGIQLQPRMSEWTRKYSASAPFPNEELISLSSNVWNPNNSSVFAVLGFDITISSIQYELSRNLFYGEDAAHLQIHQFFVLAWDISSSLLVDYYPPMFDSRESLGELIYGLTTNTTILDEFPNLDQSNSTILRYFSIEKSNTHDAYDISLAIFSLPNGLDLAIAALVSRSAFDERLNLAFLITVILMGFTIISAILVSAVALRELRSSVEKPSAIDWQKKAFSLFVKPELELRVKKENLKGKVIEEELSLRSGSFSDDQNAKARSRQQSMLNKKSIEDERSMDNVDRDFDPQYEYPRRADSEPDEEEIEDVQSEHIPAASCLSTYLELIKEYVFALYTYSCLLFSSMMDLCREFILRFGFILVFMGLIAIWFVWVQYSINIVLNISDAYLSNTVKGLAGSLENLIDVPQIAARIIHLDYIDGKIPFSDSLLDTAERDAYFQNFFRNLMTSSHFGSSIHAIYIGLSDGTLSGATSQVNSNDTFFHVMAKDNTTGQCFTIYPAVDNVLARDLSSPIFQSPECLYDHRQTEWYRDLALSKKASWSRRYLLHTTDPSVQINGITFSIPIIDENNEFFGAIAIDADLDSVSSIIRRSELISAYNSSTTRVFLTLRKNLEHTKDSCSRGCIKSSSEFLAVSSGFPPDILVEDTNTVLQRNEVIGSINATKIIRAFDDPFTFVSSVRGNSAIFGDLILLVGMNDVQKELENMQIFVFLVLMGTCAISLYLMSIGLKKSAFQNRDSSKKKKNARYKTLKKSKKPRKSIVNPKMEIAFDKTSFNYWRLQLDSLVKQDLLKKWFGENNRKKITAVPSRTFLPFLISQAEHHIWESIHDRDVVHSILLSSLYSYKKTFWLYKFTIHWAVQAVVFISIFLVHLPLSFFKYSSVSDWETHEVPFVVKVIEGVVIFIEIFKASLDASVLYVLLKSHQDSISHFFLLHPLNSKATEDEDLSRSVGELLHLKFNKGLKRLSLLLTILFIVLIDWLLLFFNIWTIEFYFPIRVIIVLLMNYSVRHVFVSFLKTLRRAKDEFVLYFSSVLFVAVTGNILLTGNSTSLGNTFANIVRSFTSSFVFFSTGENFVDVVYSNGPINVAYFIFVTIMGTFIVMAFVLSSFVRSFHKEFQKEVIKKKQNSRTGLFAAFSLLDLDHTGRISPIVLDEVFTYFTRKPDPDMLVQTPSILGHIDERKKSHRLKAFLTKGSRLETFVDVMEDLLDEEEMNRYIEKIGQVHNVGYDQIVSAQASNSKNCEEISSSGLIELAQNGDQSSRRLDSQVSLSNLTQTSMPSRNLSDLGENDINQSRGKKRFRMNKNSFKDVQGNIRHTLFVFLCRPAVVNFITFLVLIQTGLLCCYGLLDSRQTFFLDVANTFFIFLFFIEISLKLYAYGPTAYWSPTLYIFKDHENLNGPEHEIANRMDIFSISACIIFFLLSIIVNYEGISGRLWRFGVSFVVLRVFSQVSSTRRLIYPIFMPGVVRQFANLFVLLLLVIYVFAIYGMLLFRDVFDPSVLGASVPEGNFDSLANSMYVLFQLLVGESWHAVMYATIRMIGFSYSWYFIVYTIIVTLLFTNIFVSLILTTMERFGGRYDLTKRDFERLLLVGAEQDRDSNSKY